jgi:NAD(P)H-dependent FMN reductase
MIKIAIIIGSTRPGRNGEAVARWVYEIAKKRSDAEFELVDIKDFNLPLLDEPVPPSLGQYSKPRTKAWAAKIDDLDAYVFVTPEYNHGTSSALKNAARNKEGPRRSQPRPLRDTWARGRNRLDASHNDLLGSDALL